MNVELDIKIRAMRERVSKNAQASRRRQASFRSAVARMRGIERSQGVRFIGMAREDAKQLLPEVLDEREYIARKAKP